MTPLGFLIGFDPREPNGNWRVANRMATAIAAYFALWVLWEASK